MSDSLGDGRKIPSADPALCFYDSTHVIRGSEQLNRRQANLGPQQCRVVAWDHGQALHRSR